MYRLKLYDLYDMRYVNIKKTSCMFFVDRCQQEQKCQAYKSWSKGAKEESVVTHDGGLPVGFDHE